MTPDQINGLDAEQKANIMQLVSQFPVLETKLMSVETAIWCVANLDRQSGSHISSHIKSHIVKPHVFILTHYYQLSIIIINLLDCSSLSVTQTLGTVDLRGATLALTFLFLFRFI